MVFDPSKEAEAAATAQRYFNAPSPLTRIGWGISGYAYLSPDTRTVVKIHHYEEGFDRELAVYRKLRKLRITNLLDLSVPKLRAHRKVLRVIQMDFVNAPYLLDFAGVMYTPPETEWDEDAIANWHADIRFRFGPNAHIAYRVHHALTRHGLYYMDLRPSNLNLKGHPEWQAEQSLDSDDNG
jgi:hypothetical protein